MSDRSRSEHSTAAVEIVVVIIRALVDSPFGTGHPGHLVYFQWVRRFLNQTLVFLVSGLFFV